MEALLESLRQPSEANERVKTARLAEGRIEDECSKNRQRARHTGPWARCLAVLSPAILEHQLLQGLPLPPAFLFRHGPGVEVIHLSQAEDGHGFGSRREAQQVREGGGVKHRQPTPYPHSRRVRQATDSGWRRRQSKASSHRAWCAGQTQCRRRGRVPQPAAPRIHEYFPP